ncbi:adenosine deaminase [Rhodococcus sp. IEGM 1366]|uniref:adenosine deaminase n=1 Tax=Rhodococcus sp. IEGM 1366 TaxID=3082223 RepID=UPI002952ADBE|nr:adenosine deaminase [Rhodococcus sp. IEGM 1366]MDV8071417.1 adenosine deaminase [Rhodococcus sp. IEGM 1366]
MTTSTLPKNLRYGDLHRHLEGAIRPATAEEFANTRQHPLAGHPDFATTVSTTEQLPTLMDYLAKIDVAASTATEVEDWERIAFEAVEDAALDGLTHLELRFSPFFIRDRTGLAPEAAIDAITDGIKRAQRQYTIPVGLIGVLLRNFGPAIAEEELGVILHRREQFIGIDLAGDEAGVAPDLFSSHFDSARDAGLRTTAHAGEAAGPRSVWNVLEHLQPDRVGHGVRSVEDEHLLDFLAIREIALEVALTSNVHTSAASSYSQHQLPTLLEAGVHVALSTDDPATSRTSLSREYDAAVTSVGLTEAQVRTIAEHSKLASFLDLS